jgi:hypothetical protein
MLESPYLHMMLYGILSPHYGELLLSSKAPLQAVLYMADQIIFLNHRSEGRIPTSTLEAFRSFLLLSNGRTQELAR